MYDLGRCPVCMFVEYGFLDERESVGAAVTLSKTVYHLIEVSWKETPFHFPDLGTFWKIIKCYLSSW